MSEFSLLGTSGAFKARILDLRHQRQELIAANIANADTPGYKAQRLDFESELKNAMPAPGELPMSRTSAGHIPVAHPLPGPGEMQAVEIPIPRGDKNSVDLEQEMARQSANQLLYNYAAQSLGSQIQELRLVIDGGR
ncbi:MAG: flagellar basal body rod protein FlgB [Magnetococcus sp. WYHC-3]